MTKIKGHWYITISQHNTKANAIKRYQKGDFSPTTIISRLGKGRWAILQKANKELSAKADRMGLI